MQLFELFALPATFDIDRKALDVAFRTQQTQTHPDKFAAATDVERRAAEQRSALLNDAYKTLRDPVLRAAYLIETRAGINVFDERNTRMPADFLIEQMELRERLADICAEGTEEAFEGLRDDVARLAEETERCVSRLLNDGSATDDAVVETRKLRFLHKVLRDIDEALDALS